MITQPLTQLTARLPWSVRWLWQLRMQPGDALFLVCHSSVPSTFPGPSDSGQSAQVGVHACAPLAVGPDDIIIALSLHWVS